MIHPMFAPAPMFNPFALRSLELPNRLLLTPGYTDCQAQDGKQDDTYGEQISSLAGRRAGLILTGPVAISAEGRITPGDPGIYTQAQCAFWARFNEQLHNESGLKIAITLNHAGRRGSSRSRTEGLDRPLQVGSWQLFAPSPLPYTSITPVPRGMEQADIERVRADFVQAAQFAREANFDMLQLHMAHGYLLASFLSPLTNQRSDDYGGSLELRMRYPLEIFDAVRRVWPVDKPVAVMLNANDCVKGGLTIEDAVSVARTLKEHGCDIISVSAGQTTSDGKPAYGRGFLTAYSDRIRNEAGIPTIVEGYLTTSDEVNTIIAAGRADLCIIESSDT